MMITTRNLLGAVLSLAFICPSLANEHDEDSVHSDAARLNYVGDNIRVGVGYNSETDLTGEFFWSFAEHPDSAWVAEGWFGDDSAGGLKVNYHWLSGGVEAGLDENGNTVFSDGKVRKLFLAADRNVFDDGKLTLGFGSERNNRFWSLYGSQSTTGERYLGQVRDLQETLVTGVIDNHQFSRLDTLETITDFYAAPYDWGVGFRVGRYFEDALVRLRGGLDYESGDYDSSQMTAYASLDKRFQNSAHGISLRAEALHKKGDFEIDEDDFRVTAMWTWDFGATFRPAKVFRDTQVERIPDVSELPREELVEIVKNRVTLDNMASFQLDSDRLNDAAMAALQDVLASLDGVQVAGDITVVGHTCSLGTDEYNQGLSERRAKTVFDFLVANGIDAGMVQREGRGEHEPRFSNETEESRQRNRRVEISFMAQEEVVREVVIGEGQPITEWVQEAVPVEAAWIRRALRNPVEHKRSVDFYRYNRVTEIPTTGMTVIENSGPVAIDDMYTLDENTTDFIMTILVNDSDPEGDELTIVSATTPSHGVAMISGNTIVYTPDTDYFGADSFSYTIEDGYGGMDTANVSINISRVNQPPVAEADQYMVLEDSVANMFEVLSNDSDPDEDDSIRIISVSNPGHGTASINGNLISYTPNPDYFGNDSFSYTIEDNYGAQSEAQVTVVIEDVPEPNVAPVAVDDFATTVKDARVVIDVLANDSDPDGDPLTVIEVIQSDHPMGSVVINADGTLTYSPNFGWWGGDSFQYKISDGRGGTSVATVTIDVTTVITRPPY